MCGAEDGDPASAVAGADATRSAGELQSLLAAVADPLFVVREDGCILQLSAAAREAFGPAARPGAAFAELWRADDRAAVDSALAQASGERVLLATRATPSSRLELRVGRGSFGGAPACFAVARPLPPELADFVRSQEVLRDQDQKFRALFDNMADGMFFTRTDGTFFEVNPAACRQLGYSRAELLEMSVTQIAARQGFDFGRVMRGLADTGHLAYETSNRRKDGTMMPVVLTLASIEHAGQRAVAAITRDLTEQKRIETDLRDARDRLRAILQALPDLLFEFDADGVICDFYSSNTQLVTDPPASFLNKKLSDLTSPEVSQIVLGAIHEALERGFSAGAQYRVRGDHWMELSAARRNDLGPDQKPRVIAIAREITERKLREQELENRNDELMRFAYTVSHDLKSPLVTIKSFLGYLLEDMAAGDQAKIHRDIEYMRKAADRMDELMEDLLELSRIGRKIHPPVQLSLKQLALEACEQLAGRITACNAEVALPDDDVLLWGDRVRLLEVLQNLLDNALKFSAGRPIDGRVRVWVEVARRDDEYVVSVRDRGVGIDPRFQHKLFGLFEKLHSHAEGTGIGLALVKRIIEVHGGKIWVESAGEGCGTTVSFTLPNTQPGGSA